MERLTTKEEEIMQIMWDIEKGFVKDFIERMSEPKPPYTTVSTVIRILESKGFIGHKAYGNTYEYFPIVRKPDYKKFTLKNVIQNYFDNSMKNMVSFLIKEEKLSEKEIEELTNIIRENLK